MSYKHLFIVCYCPGFRASVWISCERMLGGDGYDCCLRPAGWYRCHVGSSASRVNSLYYLMTFKIVFFFRSFNVLTLDCSGSLLSRIRLCGTKLDLFNRPLVELLILECMRWSHSLLNLAACVSILKFLRSSRVWSAVVLMTPVIIRIAWFRTLCVPGLWNEDGSIRHRPFSPSSHTKMASSHLIVSSWKSPIFLNARLSLLTIYNYECMFSRHGAGDGMVMFNSAERDMVMQLTGSDCDPVYKLSKDNSYIYSCCRDGKIRKYSVAHFP